MKFCKLLYRAMILWLQRDADMHAAALAYFAIFALTPLLLLSITLVGILIGGPEVSALLLQWGNSLDPQLTALLDTSVRNFNTLTMAYVMPIIAIVFFSTMVLVSLNSLAAGLNHIFDVVQNGWRSTLNRTARSLFFFVLLQGYLVCIIILNRIILFLSHIPFVHVLELLYPALLFGSTLVLFTLGYGILPSKAVSLRARFYGAVIASGLFLFTRELVALHSATTPIPDLFGAAGVVIIMLVWIYVSSSIIFFGAAFAAAYEEMRVHT